MQNRKLKRVLLLLVVMAILPPPLRLIDNQLNAQNDAFFYTMSPDDREGGKNSNCSTEDFTLMSDNTPLGSGVLLLAGSAMAWLLVKDRKKLRS